MAQFEITAAGFYGDGNHDDRILWVECETEAQLQDVVAATDASYHPLLHEKPVTKEEGIDYYLPRDSDSLREHLLHFQASLLWMALDNY